MRAAIYARKSTEQNGVAEEAKSVARQTAGARAFIKGKGWELAEANVYNDDGVSGALFANRAEFQRMMRDAGAGEFDALVLFDLDRFGRHAQKTMESLNLLADMGVAVWDYSTGQAIDLDSFEGEMSTSFKAMLAQYNRTVIRKHTRAGLRLKAEQGFATGGKVFGYDNVREAKGQSRRQINETEAAVVQEIYTRFAAGEGYRSIADSLNQSGAPRPRAQQGRANGWSMSTIKAVLERPLYRGEVIYGRTTKAYGRELPKDRRRRLDGRVREKGQVRQPEDTWVRRVDATLRIVSPDLADRVDNRRKAKRARYFESLKRADGRAPEKAHGKYLLTGGMLVCPTCGGHFEARKHPWKGNPGEIYICSTRRRKPGVCNNSLALPIAATDEAVLSMLEDEVLHPSVVDSLLGLVGSAPDEGAWLASERERLRGEIKRLVGSIAAGVAPETVAPAIRQREFEITKLDARLKLPPAAPLSRERLREALERRRASWSAELRADPKVARLVLRRLLEPLTLWEEPEGARWEAESKTFALVDGIVVVSSNWLASPTRTPGLCAR